MEAAREKLEWELPGQDPTDLAAKWVAELDVQNVAVAALIASIPGDEASVSAAIAAHPKRFIGQAMVNPRGAWSADSLAAFRTVCLFPAMHGYSIQDEAVRPVFEWAQRERRTVFVHCGVLSVGVRKKLGLASPFDMRFSNPIDVHAVAMKYPDVPIVLPHFGAGYFREALMLADLCPNVYFDTSSSNDWVKYQDHSLSLREVFRRTLDLVGPGRLLFGTDSSFFPRGWQASIFEAQAKALYELNVSAHDAHAIFAENFLRIAAH